MCNVTFYTEQGHSSHYYSTLSLGKHDLTYFSVERRRQEMVDIWTDQNHDRQAQVIILNKLLILYS